MTKSSDTPKQVEKKSNTSQEKCYFSTAKREFGLTKYQIECAIKEGILRVLFVQNPHHKSGPPSRMLYRTEIRQSLSRISAYPKYSEIEEKEKQEKRDATTSRAKARDEVEFFCETCRSTIRAPSGYPPFEQYWQGGSNITRDRLTWLLRRYHTRHWHTNIEEVSKRRFIQNIRKGMDFAEAATQARQFAEKMVSSRTDSE
jgi:hypothetical protein